MPDAPVFIIGSGAVGTGLALALQDCDVPLAGLWSRRESPHAALLNAEHTTPLFTAPLSQPDAPLQEALGNSERVIIAVSDDAVSEVSETLRAGGALAPGTVIAHTSGCLSSQVLSVPKGCSRGSLHPLAACPDPGSTRALLRDTFFALEGEPPALAPLAALVESLGSRSAVITAPHKARYHAAAVLSSNLMVALLALAQDEVRAIGLDDMEPHLTDLALGALTRVKDQGLERGLTGPLVRGDTHTIENHLDQLSPQAATAYRALSQRAIPIAQSRGLSASSIKALTELLS
jgi:predicted short-subunit dehydrogenase-like oxidoreductase (DUF2520 family)